MLLSFEQFDKAIPVLQEIRDNTKYTPRILGEVIGLREDMASQHEDREKKS